MTPTKPAAIEPQRRQPTFSPRTIAAPATTTRGEACSSAEVIDNGASASATI